MYTKTHGFKTASNPTAGQRVAAGRDSTVGVAVVAVERGAAAGRAAASAGALLWASAGALSWASVGSPVKASLWAPSRYGIPVEFEFGIPTGSGIPAAGIVGVGLHIPATSAPAPIPRALVCELAILIAMPAITPPYAMNLLLIRALPLASSPLSMRSPLLLRPRSVSHRRWFWKESFP